MRTLERRVAELETMNERHETLHRIAERLAAEGEVPRLGEAILAELADFAEADVGALYAVDARRRGGFFLLAGRGLDRESMPREVVPGKGLAGRALAERRLLAGSGSTELHVPLRALDRDLGVLTLGRTRSGAFTAAELEAIEHLAEQAAVALSNGLSYRAARGEASMNRAVLDATPDGICLTDVDGKILISNAPMNELAFGVLDLPPQGTIFDRLLAAGPRFTDPDGFEAAMRALASDPEGRLLAEYELADSHRTFLGYSAPVRDSGGRLTGRIFVLRDVTAERQAERVKDEFVATVSHELRTPLTSICGYLELVLDGESGDLTEGQRRFLAVAQRNADRLLRLVGDLLFVSRVEADRLVLEREQVDLAEVARESVESARPLAQEKSKTVTLTAQPLPLLWADPARLAQLLDNLVSNAVKFTGEGGRVDVRAEQVDGHAVLTVSDTGMGIPAGELPRLFDRFFRSSRATEQAIAGTGLGLTIAQAIAESHDGRITVESKEGVGTTFRVELPLPKAD